MLAKSCLFITTSIGNKFWLGNTLFNYDNNTGLLVYSLSEVILMTLFALKKSEDCFTCFSRCDDLPTYSIFHVVKKYRLDLEFDSHYDKMSITTGHLSDKGIDPRAERVKELNKQRGHLEVPESKEELVFGESKKKQKLNLPPVTTRLTQRDSSKKSSQHTLNLSKRTSAGADEEKEAEEDFPHVGS